MAKGKLLKYRTKDDEIAANLLKAERESNKENDERNSPDTQRRHNMQRMDSFAMARPQDAKKGISGEKGMQKLGSSDGKVRCGVKFSDEYEADTVTDRCFLLLDGQEGCF